jgi:hypothetical protein
MKKLLLSLTLMFGSFASFAQLTCATATPITEDGTITCPAITTGTYVGTCAANGNGTNPNAVWFKYTASADGEVTINSELAQNVAPFSVDTRLSIFIGTCTALQCYAGLDDIDSTSNFYTNLTFPVQNGVTYYIAWDDRWDAGGFDFDFSFAVPGCIGANATAVQEPSNVTVDSAQLNWAVGIGNPASYDILYGDAGFDPLVAGTVVNTVTNSLSLTGLTPPSSAKDYYLRNNCGAEQSSYIFAGRLYLANTLPYAQGFDDTTDPFAGFTSATWGAGQAAGGAQAGTIYAFVNSSTTAATNAFLFSRAVALQANEQVTLTFYTRLGSATGTNHNLKVWVNGTLSAVGATQLGTDIAISGATYTLQTRTFTATTAGTYYFIFHNATPIVATSTSLRLDSVNMTSVLGTNDFLSSNFSVFPNPVKNVINFSNNTNAVVSLVEMTDLNGRVIKSQKVNATEGQISVSDLATGMYMMKITTDQGVAVKKIVKQ